MLNQTQTQSSDSETPWYAVQTRPRWEKPSAAMLAEKGYEVFYPSRAGSDARERPLFPSYLFCRATSQGLGKIVTTPGVVRLLGKPGLPEEVPNAEVASVRALINAGLQVKSTPQLVAGCRVVVRQGPLSGLTGEVIGDAGDRRLAVSICLLQRFVSVSLDPSWLDSNCNSNSEA